MGYKFAFDLGSTSCGWSVVEIDENQNVIGFEDMGVRIFPDGRDDKTKEPLSVSRRNARTSRVRHNRILERKEKVLNLLKENNMDNFILNPQRHKKDENNPYKLRADAVSKQIPLSELGRVLFNLSLRRGFKSNRKENKTDEGGKLKKATEELKEKLNNQTLGQFLWQRFQDNRINGEEKAGKTRFSEQFVGTKIKDDSLYPTREMYQDEFEKIWTEQSKYYSILTDELKQKFNNAIFHQRPLQAQERGFCMFEDGEHRIYKAHPLFQKFRVLQTVNQLKIISKDDPNLSDEQRNKLVETLLKTFDGVSSSKSLLGTLSFDKIKKKLELPSKSTKFNLEDSKREKIYADTTSFLMSKEDCFGSKWFDLSIEEQGEIVSKILDSSIEDDKIKTYLKKYNLSEKQIDNILVQPLEEKTGSLSEKAIKKILPYLEQGQLYSDACKSAGYNHSFFDDNIKMLSELPYYGDILKKSCVCDKNGIYKITNVSVHIALNQLRFIVNELIKKYGNPDSVAIEVARDLKEGTQGLNDIKKEQEKNTKDNQKFKDRLKSHGIEYPSREDILKLKLYDTLPMVNCNKVCIYTGNIISEDEAVKSPYIQIEHILPFSRTFDDSISNKTLSFAEANYYKGNRTPYEAFHESKDGYDWGGILERAKNLPTNVRWRFDKDAMEKFDKNGGPIARALNDTRYMTKMAILYLKHICNKPSDCYGLPGQMTALFRERWGLNWYKNKDQDEMYRASHIHHAIDAFTVACMTRGNLQHISENANKIESQYLNGKTLKEEGKILSNTSYKERQKALFKDISPFPNFKMEKFMEKCKNIIISYKPKLKNPKDTKSTIGALHEDTAYSLLDLKKGKDDKYTSTTAIFQVREFAKVKEKNNSGLQEKDFENINDKTLEMFYKDYLNGKFEEFLEYCKNNKIKKVKLKYEKDIQNMIPIFRSKQERDEYYKSYENWYVFQGRSPLSETKQEKEIRKQKEDDLLLDLQHKAKKAYKWFVGGNNFCAEIYQINPNDKIYTKDQGVWKTEIVSNYMATLYKGEPLWRKKYPTARRIMNLKINDMVIGEFRQDDINLPQGIKDLVIAKCIRQHSDTTSILFRVKKMSGSSIYLRPDFITTEKADEKSWKASVSSLQKYKARKVYVSPAGELKDPGFNDKWSKQNDTKHN